MNKYAVSITLVRQNSGTNISIANYLEVHEADSKLHAELEAAREAVALRPGYEIVSYQSKLIEPFSVIPVLG